MPSGNASVFPQVFATGKGEVRLNVIPGDCMNPVGGIEELPVTNTSTSSRVKQKLSVRSFTASIVPPQWRRRRGGALAPPLSKFYDVTQY